MKRRGRASCAIYLVHALSRPFLPATPRRTVDSYWRYHPVRADKLARALAALSGVPEGWVWRTGIQKSRPLVSFRVPPTPFREPAYTKDPGHCCVCGQPIFRFGWHRDLWGDRRPNQNATWHSCCVAAWNLWIAPSDHVRHLKVLQKRRCLATGDRLLKTLSVALADALGPEAVIARLGGDEFAIALALRSDDMARVDALAETVLHTVTRPLLFEERIIQVGAFAGIASTAARDARIPDILRRADIAMDHARSGRVARPVWFDAGMERALIAHGEIEQGIRFGLEHGQFVPYFEPQVDLSTGEIVGFEALARWIHPLSGVIGPDVFIPVAEEIGLIGRLSDQVIGEALRKAASWDPAIKISVNISPSQLADGWLAQRIVKTLAETGFPAERLVVEITESSLFTDVDIARGVVTSLKNQGVRLALDDFGTGFSSLAHLRSLPFDIIKIDRSFVTNINAKRESSAIVRAVTTLAAALRVPVCVEGIENEESYRTVVRLGCQIGQGWYFGKPMPAEDARELLRARSRPEANAARKVING